MEIVFLGTSCAIPTRTRNLSSFIILYNGTQILIDAGEDIQRQFEKASLKLNSPLIILISHMHGDHVIGLPGLLFHFNLIDRTSKVKIIGPPGIFSYLMAHKYLIGLKADYLSEIVEIDKSSRKLYYYDFQKPLNQSPKEIYSSSECIKVHQEKDFKIYAIPVDHSIPTWAFRFQEEKRPGKFNPVRANELSIPKIYWSKIQELEENKTIEINGREIDPVKEGIIGPKRPGISISYSADTRPCDNLGKIIRNSDILICESTYSSLFNNLAIEKKHMTAKESALMAKDFNIKYLFLTHFSNRFEDEDELKKLYDEAKYEFENIYIAYDLMRVKIKRNQNEIEIENLPKIKNYKNE